MPANGTASGSEKEMLLQVLLQGLQEANPGAEALHSLQEARSPGPIDIRPGVFIPNKEGKRGSGWKKKESMCLPICCLTKSRCVKA